MIWIVGAGNMAREYTRVLKALGRECVVIGRGKQSARLLGEQEKLQVVTGGLGQFLETSPPSPQHAIVCTPVDSLASVTMDLMRYGVSSILVEKPAAMNQGELHELIAVADQSVAKVLIGYNRRFYQSVLVMEQLIKADGGLTGCHFEVTEWGHRVVDVPSSAPVKRKWILANTSHVIDLAFFEAGYPVDFCSYTSGTLDWHPSASRFVGAGISEQGALLSYMGYWDGPGRWSLEFLTKQRRFILRPMERLAVQQLGEISVADVLDIDYSIDEQFKPGLYLQTQNFLQHDHNRFCTLDDQLRAIEIYEKIAAYGG